MVRLYEVRPTVCDDFLEKFSNDSSVDVDSIFPDLRRHAHRQKLNRELYEKYGQYKNIILDPRFQLVKSYIEENLDLDFMGEPFMPLSTAIIVLFMLSGRLTNKSSMILITLFVFNFNPIYVTFAILLWWLAYTPSRKPKQFCNVKVPKNVTTSDPKINDTYDHILLGSDIGTLYTAALLSKCGHTCCVIEPQFTDKLEVFPDDAPCAVPLYQCIMTNPERYQTLLDAAQISTSKSRVKIAPIGNSGDGYINGILTIKESLNNGMIDKRKQTIVYSRPGEEMFFSDTSYLLREEKSMLKNTWNNLKFGLQQMTSYLIRKCVKEEIWNQSELSKLDDVKKCEEFIESSVEKVLINHGVSNSLLHYIHLLCCTFGGCESLPMHHLSAASFASVLSGTENGRFVAVGGINAIKEALMHTIEQYGGIILRDVNNLRLELEQYDQSYKAVGITISKLSLEQTFHANKSIISGLGVLATYGNLLPLTCLQSSTKLKLTSLKEMRPKIRVIIWLNGTIESLQLTSAEYFEIQKVLDIQKNEKEEDKKGSIMKGDAETLAKSFVHIWSPSAQDPSWITKKPSNVSVLIVEFEAIQPDVNEEKWDINQQSSTSSSLTASELPTFYTSSLLPESSPNHEKFSDSIGRKLSLSSKSRQYYLTVADKLMKKIYPQTMGKTIYTHIETTSLGGHHLANDCQKMSAKINSFTDVENLYLTGSDLSTNGFMGELQSGWIAANAVLGYDLNELQKSRNIVADLLMSRK